MSKGKINELSITLSLFQVNVWDWVVGMNDDKMRKDCNCLFIRTMELSPGLKD